MPDSTLILYAKEMNFADARIAPAHGVLICSSVNDKDIFAISGGLDLGVYHIYDLNFYYYNLRENAERRVNRFFQIPLLPAE